MGDQETNQRALEQVFSQYLPKPIISPNSNEQESADYNEYIPALASFSYSPYRFLLTWTKIPISENFELINQCNYGNLIGFSKFPENLIDWPANRSGVAFIRPGEKLKINKNKKLYSTCVPWITSARAGGIETDLVFPHPPRIGASKFYHTSFRHTPLSDYAYALTKNNGVGYKFTSVLIWNWQHERVRILIKHHKSDVTPYYNPLSFTSWFTGRVHTGQYRVDGTIDNPYIAIAQASTSDICPLDMILNPNEYIHYAAFAPEADDFYKSFYVISPAFDARGGIS